jgi:hypothetical protein
VRSRPTAVELFGAMKTIVVLIGLALMALGPTALLMPEVAAGGYGVPADTPEARAYLLATAARDLALGCWLLAMLGLGVSRRALAASVLAIALVALSDAMVLVTYTGSFATPALAVHVAGLIVLLAVGSWLWRAPAA